MSKPKKCEHYSGKHRFFHYSRRRIFNNNQGYSGAGTRGNGVPTPFSRFASKRVWSCFKMASFFGCVPTPLLPTPHPWLQTRQTVEVKLSSLREVCSYHVSTTRCGTNLRKRKLNLAFEQFAEALRSPYLLRLEHRPDFPFSLRCRYFCCSWLTSRLLTFFDLASLKHRSTRYRRNQSNSGA